MRARQPAPAIHGGPTALVSVTPVRECSPVASRDTPRILDLASVPPRARRLGRGTNVTAGRAIGHPARTAAPLGGVFPIGPLAKHESPATRFREDRRVVGVGNPGSRLPTIHAAVGADHARPRAQRRRSRSPSADPYSRLNTPAPLVRASPPRRATSASASTPGRAPLGPAEIDSTPWPP